MNQPESVATLSFVVFAALVVVAIFAIRKRASKQSDLGVLNAPDSLSGKVLFEAAGDYVSTVFTAKPLERVLSLGLMHRGKSEIQVFTDGLRIFRTGETNFALWASQIVSVERTSASIDRGVERGGLIAITWMLGDTRVTTNLRIRASDDTPELFEALLELAPKGVTS